MIGMAVQPFNPGETFGVQLDWTFLLSSYARISHNLYYVKWCAEIDPPGVFLALLPKTEYILLICTEN